jgi:hypothetical protein
MPMFRVTFSVETTIRGECDIEAKSEEDAYDTAEDKIREVIDAHDKTVRKYHASPSLEEYPKNPIDWDTQDAEDNADLSSIDVSEVTEL